MRKIFNFIVLLILIKRNNIKKQNPYKPLGFFYLEFGNRDYYFDEQVFGRFIFYEYLDLFKDCFPYITLTNEKGENDVNLWNWQAKLLYKMAQNKYFQTRNKIF